MKIEVGKIYKTNCSGQFEVFYIGKNRIFGHHSTIGEISLEEGNILEEIKPKRSFVGFINIYSTKDGSSLKTGGVIHDNYELSVKSGKVSKEYIDTIEVNYTEK